jgi:hypothetical protein
MLAELRAAGGEKPAELDAGDPRLVPWGYAEGGGHHLYWLVRPGVEPEERTVVLNAGRGPLWEAYPMSRSPFLLEVVAGTTTSFYFTDLDDTVAPDGGARFVPGARFLHG